MPSDGSIEDCGQERRYHTYLSAVQPLEHRLEGVRAHARQLEHRRATVKDWQAEALPYGLIGIRANCMIAEGPKIEFPAD